MIHQNLPYQAFTLALINVALVSFVNIFYQIFLKANLLLFSLVKKLCYNYLILFCCGHLANLCFVLLYLIILPYLFFFALFCCS